MRLIDADKLKIKHFVQRGDQPIGYEGTQPVYEYTDLIAYDVDNAPTVKAIPLDKPICKAVYGDYVCYNRNWLMKHLPMELDILQGKAIPIEWLKRYEITKGQEVRLQDAINEWEKENARD